MLSRDSRAERKLKAIRLAQKRLAQRLEMIDWLEDTLLPEIEALKSGKSVLGLPDGVAFDIVIEHENPNPAEAAVSDTFRRDTASTDGH
jgi:hypothetical protein